MVFLIFICIALFDEIVLGSIYVVYRFLYREVKADLNWNEA